MLQTRHLFSSKTLQVINKSQQVRMASYCLEAVKKYDYENYICSLLLNDRQRTLAFAVRGFNVEIGRVLDQVTQPQIAVMRLKFWEDTVDRCFAVNKHIPEHPVAAELAKVICNYKLNKKHLLNLIKCRADYANRNIFDDLATMEKYSESSVSNIYYLLLDGSGIKNIHADHAASHLGKAQGIAQQLRTIPNARNLNFIAIPQHILNKNQISHEDVFRGRASENLNECVFEVATCAYQNLTKAKNLMNSVPKEGRSVLLPAVPVEDYLLRLQKVNYNIFDKQLQRRGWKWLPRLWIKSMKSEY